MRAGEIRTVARQAGIAPGVSVLDLCCGVAGPGRFITQELGCSYLGVDYSASAIDIARASRSRPSLSLRGLADPPGPAGPLRRGAPARDDARLSREGGAAGGDLRRTDRRRAVRLHAGRGSAADGGRARADARRRHGLAHAAEGDAHVLGPAPGWSSAGRRTGVGRTATMADSLIDAFAADADGHRRADRTPGAGGATGRPPAMERLAPRRARPQVRLRRGEGKDARQPVDSPAGPSYYAAAALARVRTCGDRSAWTISTGTGLWCRT